jgi:hypothetical protein
MAGTAQAQTNAFDECSRSTVRALTPEVLGLWADITPEALKARFEPMRRAGQWSEIVDSLAIHYNVVSSSGGATSPATMAGLNAQEISLLRAELDSLRYELLIGEGDSTARSRGLVTLKRFDIEIRPIGPSSVKLFSGRAPGPIDLLRLKDATLRSVCWLALSSADLAALYGAPGRTALSEALAARVQRWDNFTRKGYSMMPWELFINGKMPRENMEPPRTQLILAHGSVGEQMFTNRALAWRDLQRRNVLSFEPIGFVRYLGNYDRYLGASAVMAYPDSGGLAFGPTLHVSSVGHLSYLWRPKGAVQENRHAILVSLDLYRYIAGTPDKWNKLKAESIADCLKDAPACIRQPPIP